MEERRKRTPKKPEHPVREWISDNLRYMMLIGGILLILLLVFGVVRLFSGRTVKTEETPSGSGAAVTVSADAGEKNEEEQKTAAEESSPAAEPEAEKPDAETDKIREDQSAELTKEEDSGTVSELIRRYFQGLSSRDIQLVRSCVDTLSSEDEQQVADNTQITSYKDIEVYTCQGTAEDSRIAFVTYRYTVEGSDAEIPALTQFYVYDTGNGDWRLASEITDTAVQQRIQELTQTETVRNMIAEVQAQYDQVTADHPELQ